MRHRATGRTELQLPVVTFGSWALSGSGYWGPQDDARSIAAIGAALDAGIDAIDTAPVYGLGHSEEVVGRAIAGRRAEVRVLTKVGLRWDCDDGELFFATTGENGKPLSVYRNSRPDSVRLEVERSLQRMQVERLDLVQVHWPDPTTPVADTMGALLELRAEGKLAHIGVSNYDPAQLARARAALGDVPLASVQSKYSLAARQIERDVLPDARLHDVGVLVYSPLEQGLLTGKVPAERSFSAGDGRSKRETFQAENRRRINTLVTDVIAPVAASHGVTPAQVVIAWTVAQPGITSAIVGARSAAQARENAAAGDLRLSNDELGRIDAAFAGLELETA